MRYSKIATTALISAALGSASYAYQSDISPVKRDDVELIEYDPEMCEGKHDDDNKFKQHKCQFIFQWDLNVTVSYQVNVASLEDYAEHGDKANFMRITTGGYDYSFNAFTNRVGVNTFSEYFDRCSINQGDGNLANEVKFIYTFTGEDGESEGRCDLQLTGNPMTSDKWILGDGIDTCLQYSDCTVFKN